MTTLRTFLALLTLTLAAHAGDKVWCAVVLATTAREPKPAPAELAPFTEKMAQVFGYNQFELLGSATKALDSKVERWLVPLDSLQLGTVATRDSGGYRLSLDFQLGRKRVFQADARLGALSPLFINGPKQDKGRVLVIFEIQP